MAKKPETPFHQIMLTRNKLKLYIEYGDHALDGQTPQEFAADVHRCMEYLIDFRNIINGMVALEEPPGRAVLPYLSDEDIASLQ